MARRERVWAESRVGHTTHFVRVNVLGWQGEWRGRAWSESGEYESLNGVWRKSNVYRIAGGSFVRVGGVLMRAREQRGDFEF